VDSNINSDINSDINSNIGLDQLPVVDSHINAFYHALGLDQLPVVDSNINTDINSDIWT